MLKKWTRAHTHTNKQTNKHTLTRTPPATVPAAAVTRWTYLRQYAHELITFVCIYTCRKNNHIIDKHTHLHLVTEIRPFYSLPSCFIQCHWAVLSSPNTMLQWRVSSPNKMSQWHVSSPNKMSQWHVSSPNVTVTCVFSKQNVTVTCVLSKYNVTVTCVLSKEYIYEYVTANTNTIWQHVARTTDQVTSRRYVVERTSKAEIRPGEQSEIAESCRENS